MSDPIEHDEEREGMTTRELVEILSELAEKDMSEGADIADHPAHIAAILLIELDSLREQRDELVELTTTLMSYAAKDEDESKSILGYAIYAPPWLIRDLEKALAKAEEDDE